MVFQFDGERACDQCSQKHDQKCDQITAVIGHQSIFRVCKQEIEHKNADKGGNQAVNPVLCDDGGHQHAQNVDGDDIYLGKAEAVKERADETRSNQNPDAFENVGDGKDDSAAQPLLCGAVVLHRRRGVRNHMDVQIRRGGDQLFRECRLAEQMLFRGRASADNDFGDAGESCEFRDLIGDVLPVHGLDRRAELLRQPHVGTEPLPVFRAHGGEIGCFYKQCGKGTVKCVGMCQLINNNQLGVPCNGGIKIW